MKKILYFIFLLLLVNILNRFILYPRKAEIVSNKIQLLTLYTAIAGASVALFTFANNSKPNLIIKVISQTKINKNNNSEEKMAIIHYINSSNNPFEDLSIQVRVFEGLKEFNFDYLFSKKMYMAQGDSRERVFCLKCELDKKKISWDTFGTVKPVTLKINYSFSYFNFRNSIAIQEYIFNKNTETWDIV